MRISLSPCEAERLKTAVFRFAEMRRSEAPRVALSRTGDGLVTEIDFSSPEAAAAFAEYWRAFRAERRSFDGLRDAW